MICAAPVPPKLEDHHSFGGTGAAHIIFDMKKNFGTGAGVAHIITNSPKRLSGKNIFRRNYFLCPIGVIWIVRFRQKIIQND